MGTSLIETCAGGRKSPAAALRQQPFTGVSATVAAPQRYRSVPIIQQQSAITPPPYRNGRDQTFISSNSNDLRIPYEHSRTPTTSSASAASSYSAIPFRNVNDNASTPSNRAHYCASPTSLRTASGHQRERAITPISTTAKPSTVTASQKASQSLPPPPFLRRTQTAHAISPSDLPRRATTQTPSVNRDSTHSAGATANRPLPAIPSSGPDARASRHSLHESQLRQNSNGTNGNVKNTDKSSLSAAASTSSLSAGNSETTSSSRKASKTPSLVSLRFGGGLSAGAKVRQKKATFCIRRNDGSDEEDQRICAAEEEAAAAADEADRRSRSLSLSGSTLLLTEFVPKHEDEEKGITLENGKAAKVGGTPVLVDPVEDAIRSLEAFDPNDYIRHPTDAKASLPHQQKYVKNSQQLQQPRSQKYSAINGHHQQQQQQQKSSHYLSNVDDDDLPPPPFLNNYSSEGGGETVVNSAISPTNSSSGVVSDANTDNPRISTISSSSFSSTSVDAGSAGTEPAANTSSGSEDPSSDGYNSNNCSTPSSVPCLRRTENNSGRLAAWTEKRDSGIRRSNNYSSSGSATPTFGHSYESATTAQPQQRHSRATTPVATPTPMGNQNGGVAQRSSATYTPILIKRPVFRNSSVEPPPGNNGNPTSSSYRSRTPNDVHNGHYDNVMMAQTAADTAVGDAAAADAEAHLRKRFLCTQLTDCAKVVEINAHKMNQFTALSANGVTSAAESSGWRQSHILRFNLAAIRDTMYTIEFALEELLEALARVVIDPFDVKYEEYRRLCAPLHSSLDMIKRLRARIDAGGWSLSALARDDASARYHEDALDQFVAILRHLPRDCYKLVQWIYLLNVWNSGSGSAVFLSTSNSSAGPVPPPPAPPMPALNENKVNYEDRLTSILKDSQRGDRCSAGEAQPYSNGVGGTGSMTPSMRRLASTPIANHIVAGYNNSTQPSNHHQHHGVRFIGGNNIPNDIYNVTRSRTPLIKFPSTPRVNNDIVESTAAKPQTQSSPDVMDGGESTTSSTSSSTILEDSPPPPPPSSKHEKIKKSAKNSLPLKSINGDTSVVDCPTKRKNSNGSAVSEDSTAVAHQQTVYEEDDLMSVVSGSVDGSLYGDYPTIEEMRNSYTSPTIYKPSRQPQSSASLRRAQDAAVAKAVRGLLNAEEREVLRFYEPQIDNNTDELWRLVEDFFNAVENNTPSSSANNKHAAKSVVQKIQMICIKAQTLVCIARMVARDDALGASPKQQLRKFLDSEATKLEELLNECIANAKIAKEMRQSVAAAQAMISSVVGVSQTALHLKQFWKSCA